MEFARGAVGSRADGLFLDAGCGSLLFNARAYVESGRQIIAFDQSLEMLRRARRRHLKLAGWAPAHIFLLQADLSDIPFRPESFSTILCLNVLHHVVHATKLVSDLKILLAKDGRLYLTSLVKNNKIGDSYLNALYKAGDFARPSRSEELEKLFGESSERKQIYRTKGNMAFLFVNRKS